MREYKVLRHKHERQRPISQKTRKLFGPEGKFQIKPCWIVLQFLAHKPIKIASFTDSFIVLFSKLLTLWSWMQTQRKQNSFPRPKSYRDFRETVARSLCAHRFRSVAVHCFVLVAKLLFEMESDRAKWSNHVHSYGSRVIAWGVKTTPYFRTYHSWPTGSIPAALSSWILHLTVLVRVSCPFTPCSKRNLFTKNSLMTGTAPKNRRIFHPIHE